MSEGLTTNSSHTLIRCRDNDLSLPSPFSSSENIFENEVNPALPDFGKPVPDSHILFFAPLVPQHSLRNSLESQRTEVLEADKGSN